MKIDSVVNYVYGGKLGDEESRGSEFDKTHGRPTGSSGVFGEGSIH